MTYVKTFLIAVPVALGLLSAPVAHAEWRHQGGGGWGHHGGGWDHHAGGWGHQGYRHRGNGGAVAGALLGLGAAAVIGGIIASQQPQYAPPQAYYAPQPSYYPGYAPTYYYPPAYSE